MARSTFIRTAVISLGLIVTVAKAQFSVSIGAPSQTETNFTYTISNNSTASSANALTEFTLHNFYGYNNFVSVSGWELTSTPLSNGWYDLTFDAQTSDDYLQSGSSFNVTLGSTGSDSLHSQSVDWESFGAEEMTMTYSAPYSSSAVPEPSTYAALAGLGVLGFGAYRRRRR